MCHQALPSQPHRFCSLGWEQVLLDTHPQTEPEPNPRFRTCIGLVVTVTTSVTTSRTETLVTCSLLFAELYKHLLGPGRISRWLQKHFDVYVELRRSCSCYSYTCPHPTCHANCKQRNRITLAGCTRVVVKHANGPYGLGWAWYGTGVDSGRDTYPSPYPHP